MNPSTTTIRRAKQNEMRSFRNFVGVTMLMSMAIVFFGMQLMMVGPLKGRLDGIQTRLNVSENDLRKLVATRESVWKTNDLLSSLEDQAARLQDVQGSLADIQTLRNRVQREGESATVALAALDRISTVQQNLIDEQQNTQMAADQVTAMHSLTEEIIQGADRTEVADNSFDGMLALQSRVIAASNGYEQASQSIASLADLTQRMAAQSEELKIAAARFDEFVGLADTIQGSAEQLQLARQTADQLVAMNAELADVKDIEGAQSNARVLVAMNDTLTSGNLRLDDAQQNLGSLVHIQNALSEQSESLSAAIVNLEIMDDFQSEVHDHVTSLETLRRTLVDIAMMESTIGRVAQMMQPLTEIGNLRRLSETEIREAARVVLDRRATRFSQHNQETRSDAAGANSVPSADTDGSGDHDLVPIPPEVRDAVVN